MHHQGWLRNVLLAIIVMIVLFVSTVIVGNSISRTRAENRAAVFVGESLSDVRN